MTPLFHAAGFVFLAAPLMFGGTVTITRSFDVDRAITLLSSDRHTGVFLVPTMIHRMLDSLAESNIPFPGETLRTVISNAAALPQATKEKVVNQWGEGLLHETYGATEYGIVTNIRPEDQLLKEDSVGTPFANMEAQIRDQDGMLSTAKVQDYSMHAAHQPLAGIGVILPKPGKPSGTVGHGGRCGQARQRWMLLYRRPRERHGR